jgi:hypothetical protein
MILWFATVRLNVEQRGEREREKKVIRTAVDGIYVEHVTTWIPYLYSLIQERPQILYNDKLTGGS